MNRKYLDEFFFLAILVGLVFAMHGKSIAGKLFNLNDHWLREFSIVAHLLCVICAAIFQFIRRLNLPLRQSMAVAPIIGIISVFVIHLTSGSPSIVVFSLQLLVLIFAAVVIGLEPYLNRNDLDPEFWKLFLESGMKAIRYLLMLYVAGFALLKFLSDGVGESKEGFLTSFMYPTIIVLYCTFLAGYWLAIPGWENLVKSHTVNKIEKT